ncbi:hypothetical protein CYMTET_47333 [Cymbomonas tetramitiformis]|uniref:Reverse transcriptase domain-containing protein n=1 Tax=Cymbomonas tetramitiformis TaxID=36881 RepID=A0AAE0EXU3_9CHLO|nr:hypothetical protein CYMTET_47333 [Cymbomonas tetramitiformis]
MKKYMADLFLRLTSESVRNANARDTDSDADRQNLEELKREASKASGAGIAQNKDQDERNQEAKELQAALLQRQDAIENKHLQHQVQLTDKHVVAQQQLSEASNKTMDTFKNAISEQSQKAVQDLKEQMAIERENHRNSEKYTQEIAMQLISALMPGGQAGPLRGLQGSSQQPLPVALDAQGTPGLPVGQPRLVPDRQRAAGVEAQKLVIALKEQSTPAALEASIRLEELKDLASFQGESGSTADALYAQAVVIYSLTAAVAPVAENCARCGCGHEESPVHMWTCQVGTRRSVVALLKKVYLPVCGFCAADVWPGAFDNFPVVSPPPLAAAADTPGDGGGWSLNLSTRSQTSFRRCPVSAVMEVPEARGAVTLEGQEIRGVRARILAAMGRVREVRELEPVRYAMEMARLGTLESGGEETVLSDHSLLSEVARHCFGKLSSEYRELSSVLKEARDGKNLTLDVIVVPLAQLVMPDKGEMASIEVDGELVFAAADSDTTMEDPEVTAARDQMREDFSDIFQEDLPAGHRPERFEGGYHRINIEPGQKPPSQPVRTIPVPMMEELKRQITKYVELGILRPSSSSYGCPIIFAPKPGGKWRMCCDYRALNNITIKDTYPLPPHDTLLEQLKGARWFSRFDFNQFFHQIPIHPDDIHKTAIRTRYGSYEWTVMPFGLTNAPATALRVGNRAFFDFIDRFLVIFMDDTIVYSPDFDSHVSHVRQFLQRCRDHQFFIRPSKVELFVRSIDFIGHHISEAGLSIIEDGIRAVMAIQPPVSYGPTVRKQPLRRMAKDGKSSLRSFLGMVGQFRRFIPKFSKIVEPLNRLLKDNADFVWESEQQQAFDNLKSAICNAPVLQLPDQKLPSIMEVDGSGTHVGQVVLQDQGKGMKPCGYHSVTLSDTQRRWPIPEIELFAIVEGFRFFRHILLGAPETIVRSDHQPLVYFQSKSTLSPKQARWLDELSEYNFRIEHISGEKNKVADALTRISTLFELTDCLKHIDITEVPVMPPTDPAFIALISSSSAHQLHDIIISQYDRDTFAQPILAKLTSSTSSQSVSSYSFELIQGLIYRKTIYAWQTAVHSTYSQGPYR